MQVWRLDSQGRRQGLPELDVRSSAGTVLSLAQRCLLSGGCAHIISDHLKVPVIGMVTIYIIRISGVCPKPSLSLCSAAVK